MRTKRKKRAGAKTRQPAAAAKVKRTPLAPEAEEGQPEAAIDKTGRTDDEPAPARERRPFPIVGIGASAGGLEAFSKLLQHLSPETGMGLVLVQHLDPSHPSALAELLTRTTQLPVEEVKHNTIVQRNHVYVIPPNAEMRIQEGVLKLETRRPSSGQHRSIDTFFRSLAADQGSKAIGVILSGTATDGTLGLAAIKAEGGITFAQDEKSARYDSMPRNAIASGCVDFILPPQEIARELGGLSRHPYVIPPVSEMPPMPPGGPGNLKKIMVLLRQNSGVDFTVYKPATLHRRIHRRMALNTKLKLGDYFKHLREDSNEVETLFQDLLINVTSFFRDPLAFDLLKSKIFPKMVQQQPAPDEPIRIWVVGCSHGQEAYSIAMAFLEFAEELRRSLPVQIFATDANEAGLEKARTGFYTKAQVEELSQERLRRFFVEVEGGYRISKIIREMCLFAKHNILADPPFSRIDLISCRNLMIYLQPEMQKKLVPMFHYALKNGSFLWLGNSESVTGFNNLFTPMDRRHKIYAKKPALAPQLFAVSYSGRSRAAAQPTRKGEHQPGLRDHLDAQREADRVMLSRFAPVGVLVNAELDVVQFRGDTAPFLKHPSGKPTLNLLKLLREPLILPVRALIQKVKGEGKPASRTGLRYKDNGGMGNVNVDVIPLKNLPAQERHFLVIFEPAGPGQALPERPKLRREEKLEFKAPPKARGRASSGHEIEEVESAHNKRLEQELSDTKDYLQSVIEQYDAANEELQSAGEEAQSTNEELQSINEELETSKEELQAGNEELSTVNQELQNRNSEIGALNNDLLNLLSSVSIPVVMVGPDLRIRRVTPPAEKALNVIGTDIGRSINDIKLKFDVPELDRIITEVIDSVTPYEQEVQDRDHHWHLLRIRPYKTSENKIDGAVIALVDVDPIKRNEQQAREARDFAEAIVDTLRESMLVLDGELRVRKANRSFYRTFKAKQAEVEGRSIYEISDGQWNIPELRRFLDQVLPRNAFFNDLEVELDFEPIGRRVLLLNGRKVFRQGEAKESILLAIEDITERRASEEALRASEVRYRRLFESAKDGVLILNPDTRKIIDANPFMTELLGYSREEILGKELWQIGLLKDEAANERTFQELREKHYVRYDDLPIQTKDGQRRDVEIISNIYREDSREVIQCNIRDITARKQGEAALQQSEARFRQLADAMPQLVWTALPSGETDYLNKRWVEYTGVTDEERLKAGWLEATHPEDREKTLAYWRQAVESRTDFGVEHRIRARAGYRWFKTRAVPICNDQGEIIRWFGTATDIDDVVKARDTLAQHQADLERLVIERTGELQTTNKQLEAFVYTIAHDLRAPLRSMEGFSSMLLEQAGPQLNERCRDYAQRIRNSAQQMDSLLMDLLGFSRVSQQRIELRPVNLEEAVRAALSRLETDVQEKNARIETTGPWPSVQAHEPTLVQVLVNLAGNALKFVVPGVVPLVRLRAEPQGEFVRVHVEDNGIGIEPEHQEQIFRLFTRLHGDQFAGTGIGLAIVQKGIERMGGRVGLQSSSGQGSTFWFDLKAV